MHDDRPERKKYGRASIFEQVGGELATLRRNPPLMALIAVILGGWLVLTVTKPPVLHANAIRTGDCLYIHAPDADTDTGTGRAIGTESAAISVLYGAGAERAPCGGSHSHEAADAWVMDGEPGAPYPAEPALATAARDRCIAAFTAHVGRPPEGSALALTIATPPIAAWDRGSRAALCLVSNRDGSFLSGPAAGSGR